jgi:hypothetical protein
MTIVENLNAKPDSNVIYHGFLFESALKNRSCINADQALHTQNMPTRPPIPSEAPTQTTWGNNEPGITTPTASTTYAAPSQFDGSIALGEDAANFKLLTREEVIKRLGEVNRELTAQKDNFKETQRTLSSFKDKSLSVFNNSSAADAVNKIIVASSHNLELTDIFGNIKNSLENNENNETITTKTIRKFQKITATDAKTLGKINLARMRKDYNEAINASLQAINNMTATMVAKRNF